MKKEKERERERGGGGGERKYAHNSSKLEKMR